MGGARQWGATRKSTNRAHYGKGCAALSISEWARSDRLADLHLKKLNFLASFCQNKLFFLS